MHFEIEYKKLVHEILGRGSLKDSRNHPTKSLFGTMIKADLRKGFPILTSRKMYYKGVFGEVAAFLREPDNISDFEIYGCNFWKKWAGENGELNLDYGNAWIDFEGFNQIQFVQDQLQRNPNSRRHLIIGFRPHLVDTLSLPACHYAYQYRVDGEYLDFIMVMRSIDVMIGLPSNIIQSAIFNIAMAKVIGKIPRMITIQMGDTHIYKSHFQGARDYLNRDIITLPSYKMGYLNNFVDFEPELLVLSEYQHQAPINFELFE